MANKFAIGMIETKGFVQAVSAADALAASNSLKRLDNAEDIGNVALFFASEEAGYITRHQIAVDGGQIIPESLEAIEEV